MTTAWTNRSMTSRVSIVPYDPDWPRRFDEERQVLVGAVAWPGAVSARISITSGRDGGSRIADHVWSIGKRVRLLDAVNWQTEWRRVTRQG